ncbi:MAG: hypothetical protein K2O24_02490 [Muribaculaceae bacterium]|nr:hypothetical protein [Muribaculaceae bacterium]
MPIVQKLTLRQPFGDIPKGTQIMVVTQTKSDRSTSGILPALRKAGYTDDQFIEAMSEGLIEDASNWEYRVMPEEDPGELNLSLARFSQPIFTNTTFHGKNAVGDRINVGNNSGNEPILTGAYWDYWKRTTGNLFWVFFVILFALWIPFIILKFILKFVAWGFVNILNICTFGLLDLDTDWDDFFDW